MDVGSSSVEVSPEERVASARSRRLQGLSRGNRTMAEDPAASLRRQRSRLTNGNALLPNIIHRHSAVLRRYRDILQALIADQGGEDRMAEARLQLVRRFAAAAVLAEQLEGRLINGDEIAVADHALLSSTLVRIAQRIGIDRRLKNVTPSLRDILDGAAEEVKS